MRLHLTPSALALLLATSVGVRAVPQSAVSRPAPSGTGVVVGTLVDAVSGEAVPSAMVTVGPVPGPPPVVNGKPLFTPYPRAASDRNGRFMLNVPAGRLRFWVTGAGYAEASDSQPSPLNPQPVELASGETITGVVIRLWKNAAMSGQALDGNGAPIVDVQVYALRTGVSAGRRAFVPTGRWTRTDDRGAYRIADLAPGTYAVALVSNASRRPLPSLDHLPPQRPEIRLRVPPRYAAAGDPTVFHSDVLTSSDATLFDLRAGEERTGVDFRIERRPVFSVSGAVADRAPDDDRPIELWLQPAGGDRIPNDFDQRRVLADTAGRFTFPAVPAGTYTLETVVTPRIADGRFRYEQLGLGTEMHLPNGRLSDAPAAAALWATTLVTVRNANLDDIAVGLRPGSRIVGRVVFGGSSDKPTPTTLAATTFMAEATDGRRFDVLTASGIRADGTFETAGLPPGAYRLVQFPYWNFAGWSHASLEIEGTPSTGRPIVVGTSNVHVVMRFSDRQTELTGMVTGPGRSAPGATVYVFSTDRETWTHPLHTGTTFELRPTRTGAYQTSLPPGEYFVTAVDATPGSNWRTVDALDALSKTARTVNVALGQTATVDVVLSQGRQLIQR